MKERILKYIDKHYTDEDISISRIADDLNMSNSYLSHYFKEQVGENLVYYIGKLRIEKSLELLKDVRYSVSDVAKIVGCGNSNNFIRVFKKIEGITPGQYKGVVDPGEEDL